MDNKKPLKIYASNFGKHVFETSEEFLSFTKQNNLQVKFGLIKNPHILERKPFSNKGNALDGYILAEEGYSIGLNMGGNPIGTGWKQYIPFLEEMDCKKLFGLYNLKSILNKPIIYLERGNTRAGIIVPKSLDESSKLN